MVTFFSKLGAKVYSWLLDSSNTEKVAVYKKRFNIADTARLNFPENIWFKGNISIGDHTYINSGRFVTGNNSSIVIGKWCAIGHNVNIIAWTHDINMPTGPLEVRSTVEKDIIIGDHVWIGSNVFIREGVVIGNHSIIAANSVVIKDIPDFAIAGGVPAKVIRINNSNETV